MGYPLTQLVIRRLGRRGAVVVETVCAGLLARDLAMLAKGTPRRLRRGPALLLWLETAAAGAAALTSVRPALSEEASRRAMQLWANPREALRRAAVGLLFGLHTWRFWIYLKPDRGRR